MDGSTFDDLVAGFAHGCQSKVASSRSLTFQGHDARDVTLQMNNGGVAHALLVMLDDRVIEIVVSAPSDPDGEYRRFVETVTLV